MLPRQKPWAAQNLNTRLQKIRSSAYAIPRKAECAIGRAPICAQEAGKTGVCNLFFALFWLRGVLVSKISRMSVKTLNSLSCSKKAQGLSLNTIIIAIIVIIVLVVIVMIFTGYFGRIFTPSVKSCTAQGGECAEQCGVGQLGNEVVSGECSKKADGTQLRCCSKIPQDQFNTLPSALADCSKSPGQSCNAAPSCAAISKTDATGSCASGEVCCKVGGSAATGSSGPTGNAAKILPKLEMPPVPTALNK